MDTKKRIILIILTSSIACLVCLLYLFSKINKTANYNNMEKTENIRMKDEVVSKKLVTSYEDYYSVLKAVKKYIVFLSIQNNEKLYSVLDSDYIDKNSITKENVLSKIKNTEKSEIFVTHMYIEEEQEYLVKYLVEGLLYEENETDINNEDIAKRDYESIELEVNLDKSNATFSIIPKEGE